MTRPRPSSLAALAAAAFLLFASPAAASYVGGRSPSYAGEKLKTAITYAADAAAKFPSKVMKISRDFL